MPELTTGAPASGAEALKPPAEKRRGRDRDERTRGRGPERGNLIKIPEFTAAKRKIFEEQLTEGGKKILEEGKYKLFSPVAVFVRGTGIVPGGFIVGVAEGKKPAYIVARANPDGTEVYQSIKVPVSDADRLLEPAKGKLMRRPEDWPAPEPPKLTGAKEKKTLVHDLDPELKSKFESEFTDEDRVFLATLGYVPFQAVDVKEEDGKWVSGRRIVKVFRTRGLPNGPEIGLGLIGPDGHVNLETDEPWELDAGAFKRLVRPTRGAVSKVDRERLDDARALGLRGPETPAPKYVRPDEEFVPQPEPVAAAAAAGAPPTPPENPPKKDEEEQPAPQPEAALAAAGAGSPPPNEPPAPREQRMTEEEERRLRLAHMMKLHGGIYEGKSQKLDIRIVDLSAWIEQLAELVAENKLRAYMNRKGVGAFFSKAFAHLDEDAYRRKFYLDTLHAIESNRNLKASLEARVFGKGAVESDDPHVRETLAQFDDVLRHFAEGLHDEEERGDRFVADERLNGAASDLFVEYATTPNMDRTAFEQRVEDEIIPLMSGRNFAKDGKGGLSTASERENRMHASNLWHWAETYKEQVAQMTKDAQEKYGEKDPECIRRYVKGMLKLDLNIELSKRGRDLVNRDPSGQIIEGTNKVSKLSNAEKAVSWLQNKIDWDPANKVLGAVMANPVAMGIVGAIAGRAGVRAAATLAAGTALGAVLSGPMAVMAAGVAGGTLAAGLFAKIRASKELKQDRGMVARDRALGRTPGGPRAERMAEHVHEMESADRILEQLRGITGQEANPEAREAALRIIADTRARLEVRLQYAKDTIRVSAEEGERDLSLANAVDDIKRQFQRIGAMADKNNTPALAQMIEARKQELLQEIAATDEKFDTFRKKESNRRALIGAAVGLASGAAMGWMRHAFHDQFEAVGSSIGSAAHRLKDFMFGGSNMPATNPAMPHIGVHEVPFENGTMRLPADRMFISDGHGNGIITTNYGAPVSPPFHINPDGTVVDSGFGGEMAEWGGHIEHATQVVHGTQFSEHLQPIEFSNHAVTQHFEVPDNMNLSQAADGTFNITDHSGNVIEGGIQIGPDGKLLPASANLLRAHGWDLREGVHVDHTSLDKDHLTKFLRDHMGQTKAHRIDWHGNGTPMHKVGGHWVSRMQMDEDLGGKVIETTSRLKPAGLGSEWTSHHVGGRWVGADGKELQLKLDGDGAHRIISLKDMIKNSIGGKINSDGSIDNHFGDLSDKVEAKAFADAASHFKVRVFVGDNYWHGGESFELPVGPDGTLAIDQNDELYGVLFDSHGNLKATLEATVPDDSGLGYHTLATAVRHGDGAGILAHKSSFFQMSHPNKDVVHHYFDWQEQAPTLPPKPVPTDDIPFIFPIPWTPRNPMEVPTLNAQDKMGPRSPRGPISPEALKANEELSKKIVEGADFTTVVEGKRGHGEEMLGVTSESHLIDSAVQSYAVSNDIALTAASLAMLREKIVEARIQEIREPLKWNKPFAMKYLEKSERRADGTFGFEDESGNLLAIEDFESRLAVARPRPEYLTIHISDAMLAKFKTTEEELIAAYGKTFAEKFGAYGVKVHFVTKKEMTGGGTTPPPEKEYPLMRITHLPVRTEIVGGEKFSGEAFKNIEIARLIGGTRGGSREPVVYALDEGYIKKLIGKKLKNGGEITNEAEAVAFFKENIEKVIGFVEHRTGIRPEYRVVVGTAGIDGATKELRDSFSKTTHTRDIIVTEAPQVEPVAAAEPETAPAAGAPAAAEQATVVNIPPLEIKRIEALPGQSVEAVNFEVKAAVAHTESTKEGDKENEDAQFIDRVNEIYGVFDGMGGHANGKIASNLTSKAFQWRAKHLRDIAQKGSAKEIASAIDQVFADVQQEVEAGMLFSDLLDGGTTAAIAVPFVENNKAYVAVASTGDSRVYLFDENNRLYPLTSDAISRKTGPEDVAEIWAAEQLVRNASSADDLVTASSKVLWKRRRFINSMIGVERKGGPNERFSPNIQIIELPAGTSRLVLMSDGVGDNLTELEMIEVLGKREGNAAEALVAAAATRSKEGSFRSKEDDITASVIELSPVTAAATTENQPPAPDASADAAAPADGEPAAEKKERAPGDPFEIDLGAEDVNTTAKFGKRMDAIVKGILADRKALAQAAKARGESVKNLEKTILTVKAPAGSEEAKVRRRVVDALRKRADKQLMNIDVRVEIATA